MAYTGTGTQTDPYIVSTWEDFKSLSSTKDAYIAFDPDAENKVIDLNDTEDRGGLKSPVSISAHIEGNGWEIRNIVIKDYYVYFNTDGGTRYTNNLHFRNLIGINERMLYGVLYFSNCSFTGLLLENAVLFFSSLSTNGSVSQCSFRLHLWGSSTHPVLSTLPLINCHIHLEGNAPTSVISSSSYTYMERSKLTGNLKLNGGTLSLTGGTKDNHNVTAISVTGTGTINMTTAATATCIVDTDLFADTLTVNLTGANRVGLTTAQMQDPVYLQETVGFPVLEVTA